MMASSPAISPGPRITKIRSSPRAEVRTTLSIPRLEPIAAVTSISSHKKWLTGFMAMLGRGAKQSRGYEFGQSRQYCG
jgi:hypothetical protein